MKRKEAEKLIEDMLGLDISEYERNDVDEFAYSYDELVDWCNVHDDQVIVIDNEIDIDGCKMIFYSVDCDDRDINAWIVITEDKEVFAYGYSGD
jgi:hypothetical protein